MLGTRLFHGGGLALRNTLFLSHLQARGRQRLPSLAGGCTTRRWKRALSLYCYEAEAQESAGLSPIRGMGVGSGNCKDDPQNVGLSSKREAVSLGDNASVSSDRVVGGAAQILVASTLGSAGLDSGCLVKDSEVDVRTVEKFVGGMDIEPFERVGLSRKALERILARDKELLSYTGGRLKDGLKALVDLGVQKEYVADLVQHCPRVLVQDLEAMLMPMLEELGVGRQAISRLLRYNPRRVMRVHSTNFRKNVEFLESVGLSKQQVASAVRASPQLLILDLDTEILPKLEFLQSYGVTQAGIRNIVLHFPSILNHNIENNLLPKIRFLESVGVKNIGMVLSRSPGFLGLSIEKNVAPKIKQLESIGFSSEVIGSVIERSPTILSLRFDNMKQKLTVFESMGFTADEIARILCRSPVILGLNVENNLLPKIQFLQELIVDKSKMAKVLMNCPTFFQFNLDNHLRPLVAFLERIGARGERLRSLIVAKPIVLTLSLDGSLAQTIKFLEEIGLEVGTPAMARAFSSCFSNRVASMQSRLDWLVEYGFTQDQARIMARKQPSILTIGDENMATKMEFLTRHAGLGKAEIVKGVALLTYSLEARMKPRHRVITWLKDKDRLKRFSVSSAMVMSDERFLERFIKADPEAAAVYYAPSKGKGS